MAARVPTFEATSGTVVAFPTRQVPADLPTPCRPEPATADPARRGAPPAPVTGWRRLLGDWMVVSGATAVCHAVGAVTGLLLRMLLDPAQMGIWQGVKLFLSYGNYANLGISKGAAREFTVALGRDDTQGAKHGLDLAFTVNTLTSVFYGALLIGAGAWLGLSGGGAWAGSWATGLAVSSARFNGLA